jgi:hypothetical protein
MAYKFQLGSANLQGAAIIQNDLDAEAGQVKAAIITGSTLTVTGTSTPKLSVGDAITLSDVSGDEGIQFVQGSDKLFHLFELDNSSGDVGAALEFGSGSTANLVSFKKTDNSDELFGMEVRAAAQAAASVKANYASGKGLVSGSGNFQFGGNAQIGETGQTSATCRLDGTLTVVGTTNALNSQDVEIRSKIAIDGDQATQANVVGSRFIFGDGASAAGAAIEFKTAVAAGGYHFALTNGNDSAGVRGQANLVGDGSNLSGLGTAGALNFSIASKDSTASNADKVLEKGKINVVGTANNGTGNALDMPAISGLSAGDIISVKFSISDLEPSVKSITISGNGSDTISIDGSATIVVDSPNAAVDFVYIGADSGTGRFIIT